MRIKFDGTEGELETPATNDKTGGVVLVQEYWGVNDHIRDIVKRLAGEGFRVLAPDLYHGKVTADAGEAQHMMSALDWARAVEDLAGAITYLRAHSNGKVAVAGFCMGGALSFAIATQVPGLAAVCPFYGVPPGGDWSKVDAPIQAHISKTDDWASPDKVEAILAQVKTEHELHLYDAPHAFMNENRPEVYSKEAAALAWSRMLAFLRKHT